MFSVYRKYREELVHETDSQHSPSNSPIQINLFEFNLKIKRELVIDLFTTRISHNSILFFKI